MGKMLGGDEEKDPDAAKKEEERQEALRQEEEERQAKYARMEAEREAMRQGIRDKVGGRPWCPRGPGARRGCPGPGRGRLRRGRAPGARPPLLSWAPQSRPLDPLPGGGSVGGEQGRGGHLAPRCPPCGQLTLCGVPSPSCSCQRGWVPSWGEVSQSP